MATNTGFTHRAGTQSGNHRLATRDPGLLSPARLVLTVACLVAALLMLATIASVARAQVQKGEDFRFAQSAPPAAPQFYANHGGPDKPDVQRLEQGLQRVGFTR